MSKISEYDVRTDKKNCPEPDQNLCKKDVKTNRDTKPYIEGIKCGGFLTDYPKDFSH